jgi:hypothetical protein
MTAWTPLLDRLEERLRRISDSVGGAARSGAVPDDVGPPPEAADRPGERPTEAELIRLHTLVAAHDQLDARLHGRRTALQQAERYALQTGS